MCCGLALILSAQNVSGSGCDFCLDWTSKCWGLSTRTTHKRVGFWGACLWPFLTSTNESCHQAIDPYYSESSHQASHTPLLLWVQPSASLSTTWERLRSAISDPTPSTNQNLNFNKVLFLSNKVKCQWTFLFFLFSSQLQYVFCFCFYICFFFVIAYTLHSIQHLEITLVLLFKRDSGTHFLKTFQITLHIKANWWEACLHEYASCLYHRLKTS